MVQVSFVKLPEYECRWMNVHFTNAFLKCIIMRYTSEKITFLFVVAKKERKIGGLSGYLRHASVFWLVSMYKRSVDLRPSLRQNHKNTKINFQARNSVGFQKRGISKAHIKFKMAYSKQNHVTLRKSCPWKRIKSVNRQILIFLTKTN